MHITVPTVTDPAVRESAMRGLQPAPSVTPAPGLILGILFLAAGALGIVQPMGGGFAFDSIMAAVGGVLIGLGIASIAFPLVTRAKVARIAAERAAAAPALAPGTFTLTGERFAFANGTEELSVAWSATRVIEQDEAWVVVHERVKNVYVLGKAMFAPADLEAFRAFLAGH